MPLLLPFDTIQQTEAKVREVTEEEQDFLKGQ